ncbi:YhcH/YjgK/YiaL family protein [Leptotrichia hongkongensis]|uniref:YhcH/YjgK/YiaL family protein n=1 Tax=Leptotrichia hongkongensis TaxID=554406 RepID=A0ABV4S7S9_9FUSO
MIITNVNNEIQNKSLAKDIRFCIEFAKKNENKILSLVNGSYDVGYNNIKMNLGKYFTKSENEKFWESHKKYLDVQIMINGTEKVAINDIRDMEVKSFDEEKDLTILEGDKAFDIVMKTGDVLVFFPNDVHKPELNVSENDDSGNIRKIVTKVVFKIEINKMNI